LKNIGLQEIRVRHARILDDGQSNQPLCILKQARTEPQGGKPKQRLEAFRIGAENVLIKPPGFRQPARLMQSLRAVQKSIAHCLDFAGPCLAFKTLTHADNG
jgi:hypothetical protein